MNEKKNDAQAGMARASAWTGLPRMSPLMESAITMTHHKIATRTQAAATR